LLENTSTPEINIYGENPTEIWEEFSTMFKKIEAAGGIVKNKEEKFFSSTDLEDGICQKES
jgi:hypothetical protein